VTRLTIDHSKEYLLSFAAMKGAGKQIASSKRMFTLDVNNYKTWSFFGNV